MHRSRSLGLVLVALLATGGLARANAPTLVFHPSSTASQAAKDRLTGRAQRVAKLLKGKLGFPAKVNVHMEGVISLIESPMRRGEPTPGHDYKGGEDHVKIGDAVVHGGKRSSTEGADVMSSHELGHAVFQAALMQMSPRYAKKQARIDKNAAALEVESGKLYEVNRQQFQATDPAAKEALKLAYDRAAKKMGALQRRIDKDRRMLSGAKVVHELFADALTIFDAENPSAIVDALKEIRPEGSALRDFSVKHSVKQTKALMGSKAHDLAAPLRSLIGKVYQRRAGEALDPRAEMLEAIADHAVALVEHRLRHGHSALGTLSIEGFNRDLRKRLLADPRFAGPGA